MMKHLWLIFFLSIAVYSPSIQASTGDFVIFPQALFTDQDEKIILTYEAGPNKPVTHLFAVLLTEEGTIKKELGPLNDDGIMGDKQRGDGLFTRKVNFKESKAKKIRIGLVEGSALNAPILKEGVLSIDHRPSFVEIMQNIWKKL